MNGHSERIRAGRLRPVSAFHPGHGESPIWPSVPPDVKALLHMPPKWSAYSPSILHYLFSYLFLFPFQSALSLQFGLMFRVGTGRFTRCSVIEQLVAGALVVRSGRVLCLHHEPRTF